MQDFSLASARRAAARLRIEMGCRDGQAFPLEPCCDALGVDLRDSALGSRAGGCEALLVPLPNNRFRIVVDSQLSADAQGRDAKQTACHRRRFRIAHEIGHIGFYTRGQGRPGRFGLAGTQEEEDYCDEFARCLLAPPPSGHLTASEIVGMHRRHEVSLEVASRSAAAGAARARVALWWWRKSPPGKRDVLMEQWASDGVLTAELGISPFRTDPATLESRVEELKAKLGERLSVELMPRRRQALLVLRS